MPMLRLRGSLRSAALERERCRYHRDGSGSTSPDRERKVVGVSPHAGEATAAHAHIRACTTLKRADPRAGPGRRELLHVASDAPTALDRSARPATGILYRHRTGASAGQQRPETKLHAQGTSVSRHAISAATEVGHRNLNIATLQEGERTMPTRCEVT
jgi:hypothetical protein